MEWFSNPIGQATIKNMVKTTIADIHHESSIAATVQIKGKTVEVVADTATNEAEHTLQLELLSATGNKVYDFVRNEQGMYETSLSIESAGVYELLISEKDAGGKVIDTLTTGFAIPYLKEYDAFAEGGETLLQQICDSSGGERYQDMKALASAEIKMISFVLNPRAIFGILSLVLLLSDIAIRRLRWKDLKRFFVKK